MSVATLIADARVYANGIVVKAQDAMSDATALVQSVGYIVPNFTPATFPNAPPDSIDMTLPTLSDVALELPTEPGSAPVFQDIGTLDVGAAPTLNAVVPTLIMPTKPSQVAEFLEAAPGLSTDVVFPDAPEPLLAPPIAAPTVADRAAPVAPTVALPGFSAMAPTDVPVAPTNLEGTVEDVYRSALPSTIAMAEGYADAWLAKMNPQFHTAMASIESKLAEMMDGGTGLNPDVENAIHERERDKISAGSRAAQEALLDDFASRGFKIPPGAVFAAQAQARQAGADNLARAGREITVMQDAARREHLRFALERSISVRATMVSATIGYFQNIGNINGQALEYAKTVLGAVIESYNTAQKVFALRLDAYRAEAAVYEVKLKAAMASMELYKAEIQALEALTNVDRAKVAIYQAQIDSLATYANVWKLQIDAILGKAQLEKLKIDLFKTKVEAYSVTVSAKDSEWKAFTAQLEGETSKVKLYQSQVEAYGAQTVSFKAVIDGKARAIEAAATTNKARADQYAAELNAYATVADVRGKKAGFELENQRQVLIAFDAQTKAKIANYQVQSDYYKTTSNVALSNAELKFRVQKEEADSTRAYGNVIAQLGQYAAQIHSSLANASMSGMNTFSGENKNE